MKKLVFLFFLSSICIAVKAQTVRNNSTVLNTNKTIANNDITGIIELSPTNYNALEQTVGGNLLQSGVAVELWQVEYKDKIKTANDSKQTVIIYLKQKITQSQLNLQKVETGIKYTISNVPNIQNLVVLTYFAKLPPQTPNVRILGRRDDRSGRQSLMYLCDAKKFIGKDKTWGLNSVPVSVNRSNLNFPTMFADANGFQMSIWDDIGDFFEGLGDAVEGLAGVFINGVGGLLIQTGMVVYDVIAYGNLPAYRFLTDEEYKWANDKIYNGTLPPKGSIVVTNMMSVNYRQFTIPNGFGAIYMNMGDGFGSPNLFTYARNGELPGQVFIHELGHAWQIEQHKGTKVAEEGLSNIAKGEGAYEYSCGQNWDNYNFEQQASIIEHCFMRREYNRDKSLKKLLSDKNNIKLMGEDCQTGYVEKNVRFAGFTTTLDDKIRSTPFGGTLNIARGTYELQKPAKITKKITLKASGGGVIIK